MGAVAEVGREDRASVDGGGDLARRRVGVADGDVDAAGRERGGVGRRLGVVGTPYLAGAARPLADGVAGAVRLARITLGDAVRMATLNPGRFAGGGRGTLRPGAPADLVRFGWQPGDETLQVEAVLVAGVRVR